MEDLTVSLQNVKTYANSLVVLEQERSGLVVNTASQVAYEGQLDRTIQHLQDQVKQHEVALNKLRASSSTEAHIRPSAVPSERLSQILTIKSAFDSLTASDPSFPPPESPLPALIALRETHQTIKASRDAIDAQRVKLKETSNRLEKENAEMGSARLIMEALEKRIERLKGEDVQQKSPLQIAEDMISEQQTLGKATEKDLKGLIKALHKFIDNDMAAMLAAEELGGPTVGDEPDMDEEAIEVGYTQKGRAKGPKTRSSTESGTRVIDMPLRGKNENGESGQGKKERAAGELRALLEELMRYSNQSGSSTYINIKRESAASRFLIRAKVAQYHPKDAQRIRLVEFGRGIED